MHRRCSPPGPRHTCGYKATRLWQRRGRRAPLLSHIAAATRAPPCTTPSASHRPSFPLLPIQFIASASQLASSTSSACQPRLHLCLSHHHRHHHRPLRHTPRRQLGLPCLPSFFLLFFSVARSRSLHCTPPCSAVSRVSTVACPIFPASCPSRCRCIATVGESSRLPARLVLASDRASRWSGASPCTDAVDLPRSCVTRMPIGRVTRPSSSIQVGQKGA